MNNLKKTLSILFAAVMLVSLLSACGEKAPATVDPATCSYDEMVSYLMEKGYISKEAKIVDINVTEGYVVDNTGGEFPYVELADEAKDYDGLWLFHWNEGSETYETVFVDAGSNGGALLYMGGAAFLQSEAINGKFAIAFSEDYAQKDAALADFKALPGT